MLQKCLFCYPLFIANYFLKKIGWLTTKFIFIVLFLLTLFLLPRMFNLGNDISNSDALRWHRRSDKFLSALKTGDFKQTFQRYHPGVTVMWIGATAELALYKYQQIKGEEVGTLENTGFFPRLHGLSKLLLVLVLATSFVLCKGIIRPKYGSNLRVLNIFGAVLYRDKQVVSSVVHGSFFLRNFGVTVIGFFEEISIPLPFTFGYFRRSWVTDKDDGFYNRYVLRPALVLRRL